MAQITFTIPDAQAARILDGFAMHHKYRVTVDNPGFDPEEIQNPQPATIPNPESKSQFLKRKMIEFVKDSLKAEETRSAMAAARVALPSEPDIS